MSKNIISCGGLLLLFFVIFNLSAAGVSAEITNDVCADCHDEVSEIFHTTAHGTYLSDNKASCESCHGSAIEHVEDGDPTKIINPSKADQFGDLLCINCHDNHQFDEWSFSSHNNADVTCSNCHNVHVAADVKKSSSDGCFTCHVDVKASLMMPSHHPIGEGKLECVDCHDVHGNETDLTMSSRGTELCFSCHAEKEGPFVFEHSPVVEDCMICHTPHGSVADNLLKQSEPSMCLSCHPLHFHTAALSVDGDFVAPQAPERSGTSDFDSMERGFSTKCTQCHTMVHGSDLPSQTISTGGNALTR